VRETQIPQAIEDGANGTRQRAPRPLSRPSPTANLAGNWKGDPLIREVRGVKFTPNKNVMALSRSSWLRCLLEKLCWTQSISEQRFYFLRPSRFTRVAVKNSKFYGKYNSRNHFRRALRLFNFCNGAAGKILTTEKL